MSGDQPSAARYVVGIDLGTTNCALAYAPLTNSGDGDDPGASGALSTFAVPQLVAAGELAPRPTLPSFLLLPTKHELSPEAMALPWRDAPGYVVGELARERGAELPQRLVSSSKSWLSHTGVDRNAAILPWRGAVDTDPDDTDHDDSDDDGHSGQLSPV